MSIVLRRLIATSCSLPVALKQMLPSPEETSGGVLAPKFALTCEGGSGLGRGLGFCGCCCHQTCSLPWPNPPSPSPISISIRPLPPCSIPSSSLKLSYDGGHLRFTFMQIRPLAARFVTIAVATATKGLECSLWQHKGPLGLGYCPFPTRLGPHKTALNDTMAAKLKPRCL